MQVFRQRLGSMRKALKGKAELVFMDGPFEAEGSDGEKNSTGRSWWCWQNIDGSNDRPSGAAHYTGWEVSQRAIDEVLEREGPIDGMLGFSQGATAASLYIAHKLLGKEKHVDSRHGTIKFLVLVSGFIPRDDAQACIIREASPIMLNTLHVAGEQDELVPCTRSAELWNCFDPSKRSIFLHSGRHMVPTCTGKFKVELLNFMDSFDESVSDVDKR